MNAFPPWALQGWIQPPVETSVNRPSCPRHWRFLDATGLCPACQREAEYFARQRAELETARAVALAQENADRAAMWGLV